MRHYKSFKEQRIYNAGYKDAIKAWMRYYRLIRKQVREVMK